MVDIDSTPKAIGQYQVDVGFEHAVRESLIAPPEALPGYPDGMRAIRESGVAEVKSVLVAFYNPDPVAEGVAQQLRLSDGTVLCEWRIPGSPRVTCPEFVEVEGNVKVIFTTAVEGMPAEMRTVAPGAGDMFIAEVPPSFQLPELPPLLEV
jgi:hypothetical protein